MWRQAFAIQCKNRVRRLWFIVPTGLAFILCGVNILFVGQNRFPSDVVLIIFWIIALVASILFTIGGVHWIKETNSSTPCSCCKNCGFDMQGHADDSMCPECGEDPTPFVESTVQTNVGCITMLPGVLLFIFALVCLFFGVVIFALWKSDAIHA